jgi:hypothetical protein
MNGIVKIHKNDYKTVALRVNEFHSSAAHKGWAIETDLIKDGNLVVIKSTIKDSDSRIRGTGYAEELRGSSNINKTSALENCETSAIGRALASVGFAGTEYASANEVSNAVIQQNVMDATSEYIHYNNCVRSCFPTIYAIKKYIYENKLDSASEEWATLNSDIQDLLWKAPTKGGIFTTKERAVIQSDEFPNRPPADKDRGLDE